MNKGLVSFLSILIALFLSAIYYSDTIQAPFISSLNYIKSTYHNIEKYTKEIISTHTSQAKHINELEEKLLLYENNHLVMQQLASELDDLFKENSSSLKTTPSVELVRTLSYQKFGNLNRVLLEINDYNSSKIYGLIYKELVAGIVIPENGKALGLLNRDTMSTYAVTIGSNEAPGIAQGNNKKNLIVKFIPSWMSIKVGDEVKTSGLDKLFFKGLKVGRVISNSKAQGYQSAIIEPYYKANNPNYFHIIKRVK
jgi:rod shape-determining protein MreC